ncbi:hypothetical protein GOP47_0020362 [Adiantum capillus-veneris]|uniref:Uncharacterized protein n=1 Tax=Adiantum capillus-veneris TaxID=13818 RepID=A0A9D4UDH8_ADICA|nr:hypothetical protein GOP47_0020362 [Adiantum capillus-veneris]
MSTPNLDAHTIFDALFCLVTYTPFPFHKLILDHLGNRAKRYRQQIKNHQCFHCYSTPLLLWYIEQLDSTSRSRHSASPLPHTASASIAAPPTSASVALEKGKHKANSPPHRRTSTTRLRAKVDSSASLIVLPFSESEYIASLSLAQATTHTAQSSFIAQAPSSPTHIDICRTPCQLPRLPHFRALLPTPLHMEFYVIFLALHDRWPPSSPLHIVILHYLQRWPTTHPPKDLLVLHHFSVPFSTSTSQSSSL